MFAEDPSRFSPGEFFVIEVETAGEMDYSVSVGVERVGWDGVFFSGDFVIGWRKFIVGIYA